MFSKSQLLDAIDELEAAPATYQNAEKLATFYSLYDHLYCEKEPFVRSELIDESVIGNYGDSEFLSIIAGMNADKVWSIMNELMEAVNALQPRLYNATIDKLKE